MSTASLVYEASPPGYDQGLLASRAITACDNWQLVAASQSSKVLGITGAAGDYLSHLLIVVATPATAGTSIADGAGSSITVMPNNPGGGIGTYYIPIGKKSEVGAWKVTTNPGVTVLAFGKFS